MLVLHDVRRVFTAVDSPAAALQGVDLQITQGSFVAIEGPSGCGKSTLLNIIGLLDSPTDGTYAYNGIDVAAFSDRSRTRLRSAEFAFIFQGFHLLEGRPVLDSVELGLVYRSVARSRRRRAAFEALDAVGLRHRAFHLARNLSGGERQRVAIARALASDAKIIVADEPTGNLDSSNSQVVAAELVRLHGAGRTVVLVTHSPEIAALAERRVRMRDGVITLDDHSGSVVGRSGSPEPKQRGLEGRPSTLLFVDLVRDSVNSLRSRLRRSIGLALTVGVGVALAIGTLGVSSSASAQVSDAFDENTSRDVTVTWSPSDIDERTLDGSDEIISRLTGAAAVASAALVADYGSTVVNAGQSRASFEVDSYGAAGNIVAAGRLRIDWATSAAKLRDRSVLLGASLANQLELGPSSTMPKILLDGVPNSVVGYITESPRMPEILGGVVRTVDELASAGRTRALLLSVTGGAEQVAAKAPLLIDPYQPTAFSVTAPVDPATLRATVEEDVGLTLTTLTVLAVLASIIALTNAMAMAVLERRYEFGLRRAIGARTRHIGSLVLVESVFLGLGGGFVGLLSGVVGILAVTILQQWRPVFDVTLAPLALLIGILVGAMGGTVAAIRAARIAPHEALRSA